MLTWRAVKKTAHQFERCRIGLAIKRITHNGSCTPVARKNLTVDSMNQTIVHMEYAIRGPYLTRAEELERELEREQRDVFWTTDTPLTKERPKKREKGRKNFDQVVKLNMADAQYWDQSPITFIRQVLACIIYPQLIDTADFPEDVKEKAKCLLLSFGGVSVGAYSSSKGVERIRMLCAEYLTDRDEVTSDYNDVVLCNGATEAIKFFLKTLACKVQGKPPAILVPAPRHPLYNAAMSDIGLTPINYELREDCDWRIDMCALEYILVNAQISTHIRAIVVINPGNPTGQILSIEDMMELITIAARYNLVILADEVHCDNVHTDKKYFHSFRQVSADMGPPFSQVEVVSVYSVSKGYACECGLRGGFMELRNIDTKVKEHLYKLLTTAICSNVVGQAAIECVVSPPLRYGPSHMQWLKEKCDILRHHTHNAKYVRQCLAEMEGVKMNDIEGAMYAFPSLQVTSCWHSIARMAKETPDEYYASRLLEETGICVIPGTGFNQAEGSYHIRMTVLPQYECLKDIMERFKEHHANFLRNH